MIVSYLGKYVHFMMVNTHEPQRLWTLGKLNMARSSSFSLYVFCLKARRVIVADNEVTIRR